MTCTELRFYGHVQRSLGNQMLMDVFLPCTLGVTHAARRFLVDSHSGFLLSQASRPTCPCINQRICVSLVLRQAAVYTGGPERQLTPQMFIVRLRCGGEGGGGRGGGGGGCVILLMEARGTGFLRRSAGQIQSNRDDAKHSSPFETFCGTLLWPANQMTGMFLSVSRFLRSRVYFVFNLGAAARFGDFLRHFPLHGV